MTHAHPGPGERYQSFSAFYPYYIHEHSNRTCRRIHVVGTGLVVVVLVTALVTRNAWWLLAAPLVGYGFAWGSHLLVERNRPATFTYPLWSLWSDLRMAGLMLTGRVEPELRKAGVE